MNNKEKQILNSNKGITIIALIISITIMLILASISIGTSMDSIYNTQLKGFYTRLDIVQKRVDEIASTNETYIDNNGNPIDIKKMGIEFKDLDIEKKEALINILNYQNLNVNPESFRYFSAEELYSIMDLSEIEYNVFIDFDNRLVIAADGININGKMYYMLEHNMYFPKYEEVKKPKLNTENPLIYSITNYGADKYKIVITPNYDEEGYAPTISKIKYKKVFNEYWETSHNLEMVISELTDYLVTYEDLNENSITKKITVKTDKDNKLIVEEITQENN